MFKTWTASDDDPQALARALEGHLNEFAEEVVSVGYAVAGKHFVMVVYREVEPAQNERQEAAVSLAQDIVEQAQA